VGTFVKHNPCFSCGSRDNLSVYRDEAGNFNATCESCGSYVPSLYRDPSGVFRPEEGCSPDTKNGDGESRHILASESARTTGRSRHIMIEKKNNQEILNDFLTYPIRSIDDRHISKEACEHFGVRVSLSEDDGSSIISHKYPQYKKGKLSGYKERLVANKSFFAKGDCRDTDFFGQAQSSGGKTLYITEGEIDALSLWDVLQKRSSLKGWNPSVISLSQGSKSAVKEISSNFEFVDSFEKIVLCFDMDTPGQEAVLEACKLLSGKAFIASLSEKDANAMVMSGKEEELFWAVMKRCKQYMPDGIVNGADTWERYQERKTRKCYSYPSEWEELNHKTYGVRLGTVVTITSGTGMGKTQFLRELKNHYFQTTDFKLADIALEEDVGDTVSGMMSLYLNKRIELPDVEVSEEEERKAHDYYFGSRRFSFYDHFGGMDDNNLFSKIRFFAATGHKFIFLDHLSIVVSEYADQGDERKRIDAIMTKLAKLAKELEVVIFLVVHLKKAPQGQSFEQGFIPSLDDLRGSGSLKQLSWDVIALSRNQQHPSEFCANTTRVTVLKCRFTGRTGEADYLHFSDSTGRMKKVDKPMGYET